MKKLSIPIAICLLAGVAFWPFDGEQALAAMSLRKKGEGKVEILRGTEPIEVGTDDVPVEPGDLIRTYKGAQAQVALEGDRVAFLGGVGAALTGGPAAQMRIIDTKSVETETGTVVAEAKEPMEVVFGDATARSDNGVIRIDRRSGSARAAAYAGRAMLSAPGEANIELDRLMESPATASDLRPPQPYQLNPDDAFDSLHLLDVIELEQRLGQISLGLESQLGPQKPNLDYFRALAGGKDVSALKPYMNRPTIELLLGFTVASNTDELGFAPALRQAFGHRDQGGTWGVIAAILRSVHRALVADLTSIAVSTNAVAAGAGENAQFTVAAAQEATEGGIAPVEPVPGDDPGGEDPEPPDDPGGEDPEPPDDEEPAEDCSSSAECGVDDVRERFLPSPDPSPTDFLDPVDL